MNTTKTDDKMYIGIKIFHEGNKFFPLVLLTPDPTDFDEVYEVEDGYGENSFVNVNKRVEKRLDELRRDDQLKGGNS